MLAVGVRLILFIMLRNSSIFCEKVGGYWCVCVCEKERKRKRGRKGWRTGGRNECKVLTELHGLWGLVFILRIQFGIVRIHYFVSLTRYCPAVLVVGLSY